MKNIVLNIVFTKNDTLSRHLLFWLSIFFQVAILFTFPDECDEASGFVRWSLYKKILLQVDEFIHQMKKGYSDFNLALIRFYTYFWHNQSSMRTLLEKRYSHFGCNMYAAS